MSAHSQRVYAPGQRISGEVEKILPFGVFLRLADGTRAYIRRRDLSWAGDIEPQKLVKEGKAVAEKMKNDIVEQARVEAQKIKERAKAGIEKERETVIAALKQEVADIVVEATSQLIGVAVDKARHQKIIDDSIAGFGRKN